MGAWNCRARQLKTLPLLLVKLYIILNLTKAPVTGLILTDRQPKLKKKK